MITWLRFDMAGRDVARQALGVAPGVDPASVVFLHVVRGRVGDCWGGGGGGGGAGGGGGGGGGTHTGLSGAPCD